MDTVRQELKQLRSKEAGDIVLAPTVESGVEGFLAEMIFNADRAERWLKLNDDEADLKKRLKQAEAALDAQAYAKYPKLTEAEEAEIKMLVVDDKWLAALDAAIRGEMDRVSQQLTHRVKELAERYETPLPVRRPSQGAPVRLDVLEARVSLRHQRGV